MDESGLQYTLGAGTLLGAMRNEPPGLLQWEHDVDVYVLARQASQLLHLFDPVPQLLKNVRFTGGKPLESDPVKAMIEDARSRLGASGRLVIRPSGTEPLIRVMAEADDRGLVETVVNDIVGAISSLRNAA